MDFLSGIEALRVTAKAAITQGDDLALLNALLAAEWLCTARYEALEDSPLGQSHDRLHREFHEMALSERHHITLLERRIRVLGGVPMDPPGPEPLPACGLMEVTASNILAERGVIKLYRAAMRHFVRHDKDSAALMKRILDEESQHITGMSSYIEPRGAGRAGLH